MSELFASGVAETAATWVAALATLVVLGGILGERRLFGIAQHLLAGLLTGYLALLALREVLLPRLIEPLAADPGGRGDLWLLLGLAIATGAAPWLPRVVAAVPLSLLVGSLAAFAVGGALVGTVLPQAHAAVVAPGSAAGVTGGLLALIITMLVLLGLMHSVGPRRLPSAAASVGRWLLLAGLGGWLGYLLVSRLTLLTDRIGFLLFDWLGIPG